MRNRRMRVRWKWENEEDKKKSRMENKVDMVAVIEDYMEEKDDLEEEKVEAMMTSTKRTK